MLEKYNKENMRVYHSPVQLKPSNMQKKSSINFVKNVAAPKQLKTQHQINATQNTQFQDNHTPKAVHSTNQIH
jgi:hypothetical protein